VAQRNADTAKVRVTFARDDAHRLNFPDGSFDAVICLRVLMHTPDWRQSLSELCRVARTRVVFDYPALASAALLQSVGRRVAHAAGARIEAYRVFSDSSVRAVLKTNGFAITGMHRQFVLPIAFHKRINSESATRRIEGAMSRVGLNGLFGSPVTLVAERCAS
jgi:ubiquinone/menaquinone biosynthesis C-methylase UbiE